VHIDLHLFGVLLFDSRPRNFCCLCHALPPVCHDGWTSIQA
jgi:hypothetical protein